MFKLLPAPLVGAFNYTALGLNTLALCSPLLAVASLKLVPEKSWQKRCTDTLIKISETWIANNSQLLDSTHETRYHITGLNELTYEGWYMVVSNHQSWADILVLQKVFNRHIPFLKFFLKKELIWVPVIGVCWWALDFPFMQRYSKEFLAKHPELKGKDMEITRKACEKFRDNPVSVMNFLEGTRFKDHKHQRQESPYKNLLKPKSGGIAYALNIMKDQIDTLVDVTIYYPDAPQGELSFWDFMSGKANDIYVDIKTRPIPMDLKDGDYENNPVFREKFQQWINEIWQDKDQTLERLKQQATQELNIPTSKQVA